MFLSDLLKARYDFYEIKSSFVLVQVLDRGEKIELLVDKTEDLRSQVSSRGKHYVVTFSS